MDVRLKEIREDRGIPVKVMALLVDVKENTYRKWESGRNLIPFDMACRCADFLGCTLDDLAGRKPTIFPTLTMEELGLLAYYRNSDEASQVDVMAKAIDGYEKSHKSDS